MIISHRMAKGPINSDWAFYVEAGRIALPSEKLSYTRLRVCLGMESRIMTDPEQAVTIMPVASTISRDLLETPQ